jgi:hypothetical protein
VPFDLTLIVGVAALALASGWAVLRDPRLFTPMLMLDLWVLGYHHVIATCTRLVFDLESFREHRFLVLWLPFLIAAGAVAAVLSFGAWILPPAYLYWQWFHYTRQSYGISRVYQRKANLNGRGHDLLEQGVVYLLPLLGILYRSYQNPGAFLGMPLTVLPVPLIAVQLVAGLTGAVLLIWVVHVAFALLSRRLVVAHTLYQVSHLVVFGVGYLVIEDITRGWLVVNIWHNAQYVLIVWMYNNNRFKMGVDPAHRFLSTISQSRNVILYFGVCLLLSTVVYKSLEGLLGLFAVSTLPLALIVYQTINFHHYVVDGVIWKIRREPLRERLGLAA